MRLSLSAVVIYVQFNKVDLFFSREFSRNLDKSRHKIIVELNASPYLCPAMSLFPDKSTTTNRNSFFYR